MRRRGFTLLEILVVLFVFSLMAAMLVSNADTLLRAASIVPIETHFREVLREARLVSLEQNATVRLSFKADSGTFALETLADSHAAKPEGLPFADSAAVAGSQAYPGTKVEFFPFLNVDETGDPAEPRLADKPLPHIEIAPPGVTANLRVRFTLDEGEIIELTIDAFSSGPMLTREDLVKATR